jgi:protein AATF/BFR2
MEEHGTDETDLSDEDGEETLQHDDSRLKKDLAAVVQKEESIANSISRATALDAEKGRAIKKQRTAFDTLLNTRMKLQKSLISVNTLAGTSSSQLTTELPTAQQALEAAETAAFTLWHSLNALRVDLDAAAAHGSIPRKRNRTTFTLDTPTPSLWTHVLGQESARRPDRDATLHKWSRKTQPVAVHPAANRIAHTTAPTPTILDALAEQLTHRDRLMARTRQPRSCAPLQAARRVDVDPAIYDDADFYGLLLKELLERKAAAGAVAASDIDVGARMRSENKTRRWVDTKASKGRKLRYTVHEKLQNFMAPDDRTTWGERQVEELFGGLFGRRGGLGEKDGEEEEDQGEEEVVGVEEGFNLFAR